MNRLFYRLKKKTGTLCFLVLMITLLVWYQLLKKCISEVAVPNPQFMSSQQGNRSSPIGGRSGRCESAQRVHVCVIVGGHGAARQFTVMLKSLLFYRRNQLQLHLVVDDAAHASLATLLETWRLPQLSAVFYNATRHAGLVSWIDNRHYSRIFGLYKLVLGSILPRTVDKVIVLDADLIVISNIADLWRIFDDFNQHQVIGLVENQSNWYLNKSDPSNLPWPALGRGFNTGVMLLRLGQMRTDQWEHRVLSATNQLQRRHGPLRLADQDVVNTWLVDHSNQLHRLPCQWNLQQGIHSLPLALCPSILAPSGQSRPMTAQARIVHWNSPTKNLILQRADSPASFLHNKLRRYFSGLRQTFIEYDGNLLRRDLIGAFPSDLPDNYDDNFRDCQDLALPLNNTRGNFNRDNRALGGREGEDILEHLKADLSEEEDDECSEIRAEQKLTRRTHLFFLDFNYTAAGPDDVTLISQLSLDRLQILEDIARHWPGPMSLCVYLSDSEANQLVEFVVNSPLLLSRRNIAYHVVYKEGQFYPVNSLRNVALQNAVTDFVFIIDFDFLPNLQLYSYSREMIRTYILDQKQSRGAPSTSQLTAAPVALIVPAFETFQYRLTFPRSKAELLGLLNTGELSPFRQDVWRAGHGATDYVQWKAATRPYQVQWKADYEPYLIVSRRSGVQFDTRFVGFGWNKVAFIMGLDVLSSRFLVLPNAFVIHLPHAPSLDVARFRTTPLYRNCLNKFKIEYIKSLARKYGVRALKYLQFRQDQPS